MAGCCDSIFKSIELTLAVAVAILHYYSQEHFDNITLLLIAGVGGGFIVVLAGALLASLVGEPLPRRAWIVYCLGGIGLFAAVGVLSIQYQLENRVQGTLNKLEDRFREWTGNDQIINDSTKTYGLAKGCAAVANAITFLLDLLFTACTKSTRV